MPTRALLVIDMQKDLCGDIRRKHKVEQMFEPLLRVIDEFDRARQSVIYAAFALPHDDPQFARFGDRFCIEGTEGATIVPELQPLRGPVIFKRKHSAFFETELDDYLMRVGAQTLYLTGLQTQICIMTTAADASFRGYRVVVVRECVLSSREENKAFALDWIAKYVGEVLSIDQVLAELQDE